MTTGEAVTKWCSKCGQTKPLTDFYRDRSRPDGYRYMCKECETKYKKTSAAYQAAQVRYRAKPEVQLRRREWAVGYGKAYRARPDVRARRRRSERHPTPPPLPPLLYPHDTADQTMWCIRQYVDGYTIKTIAAATGISRNRIRHILRNAIEEARHDG